MELPEVDVTPDPDNSNWLKDWWNSWEMPDYHLPWGFRWYSSEGTDPHAKDVNPNTKHVIPIDQSDAKNPFGPKKTSPPKPSSGYPRKPPTNDPFDKKDASQLDPNRQKSDPNICPFCHKPY